MTITQLSVIRRSGRAKTVPIRFDRTFHKSILMKREDGEEEKNHPCPRGGTVFIFLLRVQSCAHPTSSELDATNAPRLPKGDLPNVTMFRM